jgi:hypothetical protein
MLTINIAPKMGENNKIGSDLCLQFTYFHLYLEIYLYAGIFAKMAQNMHIRRQVEVAGG